MFEFHWLWMFWLLPLPLLVYFLTPRKVRQASIHLPYLPKTQPSFLTIKLLRLITLIIWGLLITAAARPIWYGEPIEISSKHRDMMLVVDLSGSMETRDMGSVGQNIDRLTAAKRVLTRFIEHRKGDRLGLTLFADHAYLQTPLTLDTKTVQQQLNRAQLNMIGSATAIGEGIGLATKVFIESNAEQRVMILLSDGTNNAGVIEPLEAAELARESNTLIYTVGMGGSLSRNGVFGSYSVNTSGDLDEKTLKEVAEMTGGKYFRAHDLNDLSEIYDTINQLEPISESSETWRPQTECFSWPLGLALLLSFVFAFLWRRHD